MPQELTAFPVLFHATTTRPLLGTTVLLVEDSRFASESVRLLCIRSGARIRRADSLGAAQRHLAIYRPGVVIVDLGLPDGSGLDLIEELANTAASPKPIIIATSGADGDGLSDAAIAAGAHDFLPKPISSVAEFQEAILKHLPDELRPGGVRSLSTEVVDPDPIALKEDLSHLEQMLSDGKDTLHYIAPFLQGLSRLAGDAKLKSASDELTAAVAKGQGIQDAVTTTLKIIRCRINQTASV